MSFTRLNNLGVAGQSTSESNRSDIAMTRITATATFDSTQNNTTRRSLGVTIPANAVVTCCYLNVYEVEDTAVNKNVSIYRGDNAAAVLIDGGSSEFLGVSGKPGGLTLTGNFDSSDQEIYFAQAGSDFTGYDIEFVLCVDLIGNAGS